MSITVNIETEHMGRARVMTARKRASVHLREWIDHDGKHLSADVTFWCRDVEEAEAIAKAINEADDRQRQERATARRVGISEGAAA